ncbi:hypothetical protein TrLO_g6210 [Triparma laevis f. longispina]|uniref:Ammonium transporter n=2 Tax=Triparma laevis TaxID=1534972 RepID=A0A9W7KZF0_9STRA|nr:hypothetical protein TrLO_g6210 [Triparma laevis f. longispina]
MSTCSVADQGNADAAINCLIAQQVKDHASLDTFYHIFAAALVFFMQAGFAMLCAGSVRAKNAKNIMLKNLLDACGAALGFYALGWGFAYGGADADVKTFIGDADFFLHQNADGHHAFFFQFAFAATAATIVAGTIAERCSMIAYLCYSTILTAFTYPIVAHAIWSKSGFLSAFNNDPIFGCGVVDFAGSGVVHLTGGMSALLAALVLGPRMGRFYDDNGEILNPPKEMPGHSTALQMLGTFILWTGWYGFNPGSTLGISYDGAAEVASLSAVTTTIAAASGCVTAMATRYFASDPLARQYDLTAAMNGALGGLVGITAGCSVVQPWAAVPIGAIAGLVYLGASNLLIMLRIDDTVDAVPVHMANGIWGLLAVGLFCDPNLKSNAYGSKHGGLFYGEGDLFGAQCLCILFICGWVTAIMGPFFVMLRKLGWFRVSTEDELVGLDISKHGGSAYELAQSKEGNKQAYNDFIKTAGDNTI